MSTKTKSALPLTERGDVDSAALEQQRQPVGHRVGYHPSRSAPRPEGEDRYLATLVRGNTWMITYAGASKTFTKGKPEPVNEVEFARLRDAHDPINFSDGTGMVLRRIRKFRFETMDGKAVALPELEDQYLGTEGMSAAEAAEHARKFEGDTRAAS